MFCDYYGLKEQPFGVTPDPRYLYETPARQEALAGLLYGIETGRGFMALVGPPGTGKTTLLFELLDRLQDSARTAFLFQTQCNSRELFHYLLADLGAEPQTDNLALMHTQLNNMLLAEAKAGRSFVMIIDEAQDLEDSVLETVRLLSNFETARAKLLQIVLAGQPRLAEKLSSRALLQLRQRISILARLEPFSAGEVEQYVNHRLKVAGYKGPPLFTQGALSMISRLSQGIPRDINNVCFNALSVGFALETKVIDRAVIQEVARDLNLEASLPSTDQNGEARLPPPPMSSVVPPPVVRKPAPQEFVPPAPPGDKARAPSSPASPVPVVPPPLVREPASQQVPSAAGPKVSASAATHSEGLFDSPPAAAFPVEEPGLDEAVIEDKVNPNSAESSAEWDVDAFLSATRSVQPPAFEASELTSRLRRVPWVFGLALLLLALLIASLWYTARSRGAPATATTRQPAEALPESRAAAPRQPATNDAPPSGRPAAGQIQAPSPVPIQDPAAPPAGQPAGLVAVTSNVLGAEIALDNKADPGWTTPHRFRLPAGTHKLVASHRGFEKSEQTVRVAAGSSQTVHIALARILHARRDSHRGDAEIDIITDPPGLEAFIDGRPVGLTPVQYVTTAGQHICRVTPPPGKAIWQRICRLQPGDIVQKRLKW